MGYTALPYQKVANKTLQCILKEIFGQHSDIKARGTLRNFHATNTQKRKQTLKNI